MHSDPIDGPTLMLREEQNLMSLIYIDIRMALKFGNLSIFPNLFSTVVTKDGKMDLASKRAFSVMSSTSYNPNKNPGVFQFYANVLLYNDKFIQDTSK